MKAITFRQNSRLTQLHTRWQLKIERQLAKHAADRAILVNSPDRFT